MSLKVADVFNAGAGDYNLEAARLCLAQGRGPEARGHWEEAAKRVKEMGYHRRDPEVMLIYNPVVLTTATVCSIRSPLFAFFLRL